MDPVLQTSLYTESKFTEQIEHEEHTETPISCPLEGHQDKQIAHELNLNRLGTAKQPDGLNIQLKSIQPDMDNM